jgi:valyl-tRNA synthetase
VVSERFEQARNFVNKLWNAARFSLLNLNGYTAGPVSDGELAVEDRWILSRLATVTKQVSDSLEAYHFGDAARVLYDFAWDEFCSFYLEMLKGRFQDPAKSPVAQRVLAATLDGLLRLLHPIMPFISEEVWLLLNQIAPLRGFSGVTNPAAKSLMIADWPQPDLQRQDPEIEARFALFQAVLGAVREIRTRQNITGKSPVRFSVRGPDSTCQLLKSMEPYFQSMANAECVASGSHIKPPATHAAVTAGGVEVIVDLTGLIDVSAEIARLEQQEKKLLQLIAGKEAKLNNANFASRAPADVVAKERESLEAMKDQLKSIQASLAELRRLAK